jgi:hypothetical protein
VLLGWMLAATVLAAGCEGPSEAGDRYEQIAAPADASWATFIARARDWPAGVLPPGEAALAARVIRTWERADQELLAGRWPGRARRDVSSLVRSDLMVCRALEQAPVPNAAAAWWAGLTARFYVQQSAVGRVRRDLGLPAIDPTRAAPSRGVRRAGS